MPSTVPAVKAGLRDWLRTQVGLRPADSVYVSGVMMDPKDITGKTVMLGSVTTPETEPVMDPDITEETPTLTGFCVAFVPGTGDDAQDDAREAAYALHAVIKAALKADPTAGGVIPGPLKGALTQGDLVEAPGEENMAGTRQAQVRWLLAWTSDY
jgi:hypothetical protein